MITGHTDALELYNNWFVKNYTELLEYCKRYHIEIDLLNETYINCQQRISRSGFTETYYKTYVIRSLRNLMINEKKKLNNKYFIDFDNTDYINTVEERLKDKDCEEKSTQQYREDIIYFSKMLFKYIDRNFYTEEDKFVFRCYYLMQGRMTYTKLTRMTGINKNKCTKIIQMFKNDIRTGFMDWLKTQHKHGDT